MVVRTSGFVQIQLVGVCLAWSIFLWSRVVSSPRLLTCVFLSSFRVGFWIHFFGSPAFCREILRGRGMR